MGERCPATTKNTIYLVVKTLKTLRKYAECPKLLNTKCMYG